MASVDDKEYANKDMSSMAAMAVYGLAPEDMYEAAEYVEAPEPVSSIGGASMGSADGSGLRCVVTRHQDGCDLLHACCCLFDSPLGDDGGWGRAEVLGLNQLARGSDG